MSNASESVKDKALDSQLALSLIGRDAPHDLIVNRDFVTRIGNLCDVAFIRKLNISFNNIRSLDGIDQLPQLKTLIAYACAIDKIECLKAISKIETVMLQQNRISKMGDTFAGMSKLLELRLDQNKITKIEYLSGCVSLRKLDLSFNNIESLAGISGLQQLQELKVSNNQIKTLTPLKALPSIKDLDVSNNQLKSLDGLQQMPTLEYVRADHNLIAELRLAPMLGAIKKPNTAAETKEKAGSDKKMVTSGAAAKKGAMVDVADLSGPMLIELSVSGNRIRAVHGLEVYKDSLETLDLSGNNLSAAEVSALTTALASCKSIVEVRLHLNPICEHSTAMDTLVASLSAACPNLRAIDGLAIVANSDASYSGKGTATTLSAGAYTAAMARVGDSSTIASGSQFHTWQDDGNTIDGTASMAGDTQQDEKTAEKDDLSDASDADSDDEKENKTSSENPDAKRFPHNLMLKEMLTPEQIQEKEAEIRDRLRYCKDRLEAATRTVFGFADEAPAPEPQPAFHARRLLVPTPTESGARVAAKIEEAESVSRKQSAAALAVVAEPVAATAAPERVSMKEKLVERVRMAVSNSVSALDTPEKPPAAAAVRPATAESATGAGVPVPNNPLLTDEMAASFRQHREAAAREAAAYAPPAAASPQPSPSEAKQADMSPVSNADAKSVQSLHSRTKATALTGFGASASVLGSGLTRYGTKIKQPKQVAETKSQLGDPSLQTNVSILRSDVESLDLLNLRITKPSHHIYMTEWPEDSAAAAAAAAQAEEGSDSEDEADASDADGVGEDDVDGDGEDQRDYMEVDAGFPELQTSLEAVEEGADEESSPLPAEVLYHEVKTRPDDRFGRAMAPVGGTGYDARTVRRALATEAGTTDNLPPSRGGGVDGGEEAPLRRGHSAPSMSSAGSPLRLSTPAAAPRDSPVESPALSPAYSVGSAVASVVSLPTYQSRLHPGAATVLATGTLGKGSTQAVASTSSQPKMRFVVPQSAKDVFNNPLLSGEKRSRDTTTSAVDFSAIEKEVLRATAAGAKHTRNPTVPFPVAPSGPFSPVNSHK